MSSSMHAITEDTIERLKVPRFTARWTTAEDATEGHRIALTDVAWIDQEPEKPAVDALLQRAEMELDRYVAERM